MSTEAALRLREAVRAAGTGLIEREALLELVVLAAVAREHVLVIGPPGTAKSEAARRIARALGGHYFEYLLGRFTEPSELFGPTDLRRLREGEVVTDTHGMLPDAEIAFLDEVFLGSTAILNTLLGLLNERRFRRGHTDMACPLRVCVGASNALPDDPSLAAFADRFLLRVFVEPLSDPRLEELLEGGWRQPAPEPAPPHVITASLQDVDALAAQATAMDLAAVRPALAEAIRRLRKAGLELSDRRAVKVQRLVAAAAALAGRPEPTTADLWPLVNAVPTGAGQAMAREILHEVLAASENPALVAAALAASQGPLVRARQLVLAGQDLLASSTARDERWRLKVEGVLREIDASFDPSRLPAELSSARTALTSALAR
jgi:MoxR-like ATPase